MKCDYCNQEILEGHEIRIGEDKLFCDDSCKKDWEVKNGHE